MCAANSASPVVWSVLKPRSSDPEMRGLGILVRTMTAARLLKKGDPCRWQYHPRSDHHSKVACWGILFDLLCISPLMRDHAAAGKIGFGINHTMVDHTNGRRKDLD